MKFSYSNISTFAQCPYKWYMRYKKGLKTLPETNPDNALYLGLGLHTGIEKGVDAGLKEYLSHFNIIDDTNINWEIQLEYQIPRVIELLPSGGEHEVKVETENFIGFIDYVCGDTLYDFKFSNNIDNYIKSPQLSIYKYYLEKIHPEIKINHLKYVFVPKLLIRQKKTETIQQFRLRLYEELEKTEIQIVEVPYDEESISHFQQACQHLKIVNEFPKNQTKLCNWCNFQEYCESNGEIDYMIVQE